jgi:hypothetical protein
VGDYELSLERKLVKPVSGYIQAFTSGASGGLTRHSGLERSRKIGAVTHVYVNFDVSA